MRSWRWGRKICPGRPGTGLRSCGLGRRFLPGFGGAAERSCTLQADRRRGSASRSRWRTCPRACKGNTAIACPHLPRGVCELVGTKFKGTKTITLLSFENLFPVASVEDKRALWYPHSTTRRVNKKQILRSAYPRKKAGAQAAPLGMTPFCSVSRKGYTPPILCT
jgi:hypothetical protein